VTDELPRRGDVGDYEATRDPIFLFQYKQYLWTEVDLPPEWMRDDEGDIIWRSNGMDVAMKRLIDAGIAIPRWTTERVFFTREAGEAYGNAKHYNYAAGWQVYCVCAEGDLAKLLRARSLKPTGDMEAV
jgi:hypothetical protein